MSNSIDGLKQLLQETPTKDQLRSKSKEVRDKFVETAAETVAYAPQDVESMGTSADDNFADEFDHIEELMAPFEEPRPDLFLYIAKDIHAIRKNGSTLGSIDMTQGDSIFTYLSDWESDAITEFNEGFANKLSGIVDNDRKLLGRLAHLTCTIGAIYASQRIDAMTIANKTIEVLEALRVDAINSKDPTLPLKLAAAVTAIVGSGGTVGLLVASTGALASLIKAPELKQFSGVDDDMLSGSQANVYKFSGAYAATLSDLRTNVEDLETQLKSEVEEEIKDLDANEHQYVAKYSGIMSSNNDSIDNTITPI